MVIVDFDVNINRMFTHRESNKWVFHCVKMIYSDGRVRVIRYKLIGQSVLIVQYKCFGGLITRSVTLKWNSAVEQQQKHMRYSDNVISKSPLMHFTLT